MSLTAHVAQLRTLAALDTETTVLDMAMINVIEELAEAVDGLRGRIDRPPPRPPWDPGPPDDGNHLGTI
jgi:hypothetical protein